MSDTDSQHLFHIHLVSDATGETIHGLARACLAQFEGIHAQEHLWPLVRTENALRLAIDHIESHPGLVLYTMVNSKLRTELRRECARIGVRAVSVLEPVMRAMQSTFGSAGTNQPGRQHALDAEYFHRIEAMDYVMGHDDGQAAQNLDQADVILVGVSRTSKTPTSIYLANRGIKVANVPIVPGVPVPPQLATIKGPLIVGLTNSPDRLVQLRRNRLLMLKQEEHTDYIDIDAVKREVAEARKLFTRHSWPVIDVTRRSIEETAASIIQLLATHHERMSSAAG
jgi:regulator of PEP synthase PpsR (kinase-PPPase family)